MLRFHRVPDLYQHPSSIPHVGEGVKGVPNGGTKFARYPLRISKLRRSGSVGYF